jgi:septin family protein
MKLCKETMIRSYNWTSFSPEKRGESDFKYYTEMLAEDLKELMDTQGSTGNYEEKFISKVMDIFHRQSRCASPMITGPANFNNRRNGKAWASRDNALQEFSHWRQKYFKAVHRERTLSPEEEIDKTLEELERMEEKHAFYKAMNKIKDIEAKKAFALENDELKIFEYWGDRYNHTIPSFHLTNHNNKIKERRKKLEVMRSRIERKESFERIDFPGGFIDIENDRVIIKHLTKPPREVIEALKSRGFRWSPSQGNWCRKHTQNAIYDAQNLIPQISVKEEASV